MCLVTHLFPMHPFFTPGFLMFSGGRKECIGNEWVNCKNIFATFAFTFKLKGGLNQMIFHILLVLFCCKFGCMYFSFVCNHIFSVLLHNLVLIVPIFHLKNFWITFHLWFESGV